MSATNEMKYRPDVDGLRAIAVVSVILYHLNSAWLPAGFVGVDIFFVISGFVVAASLQHAPQHSFPKFVAFFYARRLVRIVPALVVVLVISALAATALIPRAWLSGFSEKTALNAFFGLSNWLMEQNTDSYFAPRAEFNPYTHTWSLGVEEQFYVVFPFIFFVWLKLRTRGTVSTNALLLALGAASLAGSAWAVTHAPTAAFYSILYRFWELAVGVALFQLTVDKHPPHAPATNWAKHISNTLPWVGMALFIYGFLQIRATAFPWPWVLLPVVGTACLIGGTNANTAHPIRKVLSTHIFVWLGKRSYSLYLWHWPIFVLMRWTSGVEGASHQIVAIALTLLCAAASYRWIETPVRRGAWLSAKPPIVRIVFMLTVVAVGYGIVKLIFHKQPALSLSIVARNASDWYAGDRMSTVFANARQCQVVLSYGTLAGGQSFTYTPSNCADSGVANRKARVSVVGDSHATAYLAMFDQLAAETGVTVSVYTFPGCAYLDLKFAMAASQVPGCAQFVKAFTDHAATTHAAGDVIFLPSLRLFRYSDQWARFDEAQVDNIYQSPTLKQPGLDAQAEAKNIIVLLTAKGATLLFEAPKPILKSPPFRCADAFNANNPICNGGLSTPRERVEVMRAPIIERMKYLSENAPRVNIWDPLPTLCDAKQCSYQMNGRPVFFDGDHVSGYGNELLYPSFKSTIMPFFKTR